MTRTPPFRSRLLFIILSTSTSCFNGTSCCTADSCCLPQQKCDPSASPPPWQCANPPPPIPYDMSRALTSQLYSYASYCLPQYLQDWSCFWCNHFQGQDDNNDFTLVSLLEDQPTSTQAYVGFSKSNSSVVVAFRGTLRKDIENILTDLDFIKKRNVSWLEYESIGVASGFLDAYESVQQEARSAVAKAASMCPSCDTLLVTGHSLGGALATLCAIDIASLHLVKLDLQVYTLGSPRVGDTLFAYLYNYLVPKTYRIVNQDDLVPHLPAQDFGFLHVPTEAWIPPGDSPSQIVICSSTAEDPSCSDSVNPINYSIDDHLDYFNLQLDPSPPLPNCYQ